MYKKVFVVSLTTFVLASCSMKHDIEDNIDHYKRLTRDHNMQEVKYDKSTNTVDGVRFLVANYPDQVISLEGKGFDERYEKLVSYLKHDGYTVMIDEKLPQTATVIAELNKPLPDLNYIGITMEQNAKLETTSYSIFYGGNKFKARQLYNNYIKTL